MKLNHLVGLVGITAILGLTGCAATQLKQGAQHVRITRQEPGKECKFLGDVIGDQGGAFTGAYTSNKNLMLGAMNSLKNEVADLGGNVVYIVNDKAGSTYHDDAGGQTDVTMMGQAYKCPVTDSVSRAKKKSSWWK